MQTANALMDVSVTETAKPVRSTTENPVRAQTAAKTVATAKKITNAEASAYAKSSCAFFTRLPTSSPKRSTR